ncbi:MAG: hypothetical protein KGJ80_11905, partial [Chloroflexota bacterium]|nr:hypothetical protein [Chloroflexota bacterium]
MVDFGIFELIIALLAGYLGLGLVTSYLNDLISGLMGWRSKLLAVGIERMLGDAKLAGDILKHPLVASLANREGQSPSNMPPEVFTQALMELVAPGVAKVEVEHLPEYVTKLPDTLAKKTLKSILGGHLGDINGVREDVQKWIAHTNDILGALYGRRMIQTSLVVAAILTTFLGLDFFTVASYFLQKNVINASLTNAVAQNPQTALTLVQQSLPLGW